MIFFKYFYGPLFYAIIVSTFTKMELSIVASNTIYIKFNYLIISKEENKMYVGSIS